MQRIPDSLIKLVRAKARAAGGDAAARDRLFEQLLRAAAHGALACAIREKEIEGLVSLFGRDDCGCSDVLPEEVMRSVRDEPLLVGWALQVWNEPARDASSWGVSRRGEARAEEASISAATQIFTEEYMAQFLCSHIFGGTSARSGGVCDPACGTGHLLVPAFRAMRGCESALPPLETLRELFGCDIDPVAVRLCRAILLCEASRAGLLDISQALKTVSANVSVIDGLLGTLERNSQCAATRRRYGVILANPPYLGRRKQGEEMRCYLKAAYPRSSIDLCAAFMERAIELLDDGGWLGLVTSDKWLRLKGYAPLRALLQAQLSIDAVCELGERSFDRRLGLHDGLRVVLMTARKEPPAAGHRLNFVTVSHLKGLDEKRAVLAKHADAGAVADMARGALQRQLMGEGHGALFLESAGVPAELTNSRMRVEQVARVVVGLQTNDDARFVRYQWEVDPDPRRWRVHAKGGGYCRWFGLNRTVIDWRGWLESGETSSRSGLSAQQWFERSGWTYSWFANGDLGLRRKEAGWTFGRAAASGFFCDDERIVAFLNSGLGSICARRIGGKAQLPEGIVRKIPVPERCGEIGAELVTWAVRLKRALVSHDVTDISFCPLLCPLPLELEAIEAVLRLVEGILELQVLRSVGIGPEEAAALGVRPVGLYRMTPAAWSNDVWRHVPAEFAPLRAVLRELATPALLNEQGGAERIRSGLLGGFGRRARRSGAVRCDGPVERMSEETGIHPLDVVRYLAELHERDRDVSAALLRPLVEREVCVEVLRSMGHRWWSAADGAARDCLGQQRVASVAWRVQDALGQERLETGLGMPLKAWLEGHFAAWQRRVFLGCEPVLLVGDGEASFVHRLDAGEHPQSAKGGRAMASSPRRLRGGTRASSAERSL